MSLSNAILFSGAAAGTKVVTTTPVTELQFRGFTPDTETATINHLIGVKKDPDDADAYIDEDCLDFHIENEDYTSINRGTVVKCRPPYLYFKEIGFGSADQLNLIF